MTTKAEKNGTKEAAKLEQVELELAQYKAAVEELARDKQNLTELVEYQRMRLAQSHTHD